MAIKISEQEQEALDESDSDEIPPDDIVAFNELRSCADLYRMYDDGILEINPEFQREVVWKGPAQARFIDSLIKRLPIPSMCFSLDYVTEKWQVIDGLQRMASIVKFLSDQPGIISRVDDIDPRIAGAALERFRNPKDALHPLYRRVQNLTLPITVIRCDYTKRSHTNYLFTIFHRLNTGGMKLNNQEIRNCIYAGKLNDLLGELDDYAPWLKLTQRKAAKGNRFVSRELILRFFALYDSYKSYNGELAKYLNNYMNDHRDAPAQELAQKTALFKETVRLINEKIFEGHPTRTGLTLLEALLIGVAFNRAKIAAGTPASAKRAMAKLLSHAEFQDEKLREGLSKKPRLIARMTAAKKAFSGA